MTSMQKIHRRSAGDKEARIDFLQIKDNQFQMFDSPFAQLRRDKCLMLATADCADAQTIVR